jgi:large subunit ribosomal protein L35Ae
MSYQEAATKLIGKGVEWISSSGKVLKGKIVAPHGRKGVVRAIFTKGLPGEALGQPVRIC